MIWAILGIGIVIVALCIVFTNLKQKRLMKEGKIIARAPDFPEYAEEFMLAGDSAGQVADRVRALPFGEMAVSFAESAGEKYVFTGNGWFGCLSRIIQAEAGYRFEFTEWKTNNGIIQDAMNMNRLLTALERVFLEIDPQVTISAAKAERRGESD